ncbi:hypothetical protein NPIL_477521 [Nephila pilipes]|uniref:Uncharacterized protein n=1 Tax=Nephila pilipes TaxID=299642 RepID=A0A8X6U8J0_NEPPI|nr:hypothetical protein NPIL_477521 [Nephila pilipes]
MVLKSRPPFEEKRESTRTNCFEKNNLQTVNGARGFILIFCYSRFEEIVFFSRPFIVAVSESELIFLAISGFRRCSEHVSSRACQTKVLFDSLHSKYEASERMAKSEMRRRVRIKVPFDRESN